MLKLNFNYDEYASFIGNLRNPGMCNIFCPQSRDKQNDREMYTLVSMIECKNMFLLHLKFILCKKLQTPYSPNFPVCKLKPKVMTCNFEHACRSQVNIFRQKKKFLVTHIFIHLKYLEVIMFERKKFYKVFLNTCPSTIFFTFTDDEA